MADVMERWRLYPEMHIYHYAPYEPTAIKRLAGRHATCFDDVDELLRGGVFVDLYRVVRQSLRASVESYSIKRLEPLYGFTRDVPLRDANVALQTFDTALALGSRREEIGYLLTTVEGWNGGNGLRIICRRRANSKSSLWLVCYAYLYVSGCIIRLRPMLILSADYS